MNRRLILALAPATLLLSSPAWAQPAGHPPTMMRHEPSPEMKARHEAMMRQHVEDLKIILRLRPDQEAALQAFVAAHHPPERGEMKGPADTPMTTPQRLDEMARRDADRTAERARMRDSLAKFYAALSPDQQKVFDALQRLQRHGGGMHDGPGRRMIMRRMGPGEGPPMPGEPD